MRLVVLLLALLLAGCAAPSDVVVEADADVADAFLSMDYHGEVTGIGPLGISPDQAGAVHRGLYVPNGTLSLELHVLTSGGALDITAYPHGCGEEACKQRFLAKDDVSHVVEVPAPGPWTIDLRVGGDSAGIVRYHMGVVLEAQLEPVAEEVYKGSVVAAHLGAIRISPDQLGDVYREFWVPEGTRSLHFAFEADEEAFVVIGQAGEDGRDRDSEEDFDTQGGAFEHHFEDPEPGVWYFIVFHESQGPGLEEIQYTATLTKHAD